MNIFKLGNVIVENLGEIEINNQQRQLSAIEYSGNIYISSPSTHAKYHNHGTLYIEKSNNLGLIYFQDNSFTATDTTLTLIDDSTPRNITYGHLRVHFQSGYTDRFYISVKCTDGTNITNLASVAVIDYLSDNVVYSQSPLIRDGVVYDKYVDVLYYKLHQDNTSETSEIQNIIPGNITDDIHVSVYNLNYYSNVGVYRFYSKNGEYGTPLITGVGGSGNIYSIIDDLDDYIQFSIGHNNLDINEIIFSAAAVGGNFSITHDITVREYTSAGSYVSTSNMTYVQRSASIPIKLVPVVELPNTISLLITHRVNFINSSTGISAFAEGTITVDPNKYRHRQVLQVSPIPPITISPPSPQTVTISNDNQITGVVSTNTYVFLTSYSEGEDIVINNHVSNVINISIMSNSTVINDDDRYRLMIYSSTSGYIEYIESDDISINPGSSVINIRFIIGKQSIAKIYTNDVDKYNVVLYSSGTETSPVSGDIVK